MEKSFEKIGLKIRIQNLEEYKKKSCKNKVGFEKSSIAQKVLYSRLQKKKFGHYGYITIYECPFCNKWHIGNAPDYIRKEVYK